MKEKKEKPVEVRKLKGEKTLREITVKIGLTQEEDEEEIVVEVFLNSEATGLVMNLEFARKKKFRKKKLDRLIYVRNIDSTFNHERPIEHMVEVELFYREYKERTEIDVMGGQK